MLLDVVIVVRTLWKVIAIGHVINVDGIIMLSLVKLLVVKKFHRTTSTSRH